MSNMAVYGCFAINKICIQSKPLVALCVDMKVMLVMMKTKINPDSNLPLDKTLTVHIVVIIFSVILIKIIITITCKCCLKNINRNQLTN